jgi:hypothetical protein
MQILPELESGHVSRPFPCCGDRLVRADSTSIGPRLTFLRRVAHHSVVMSRAGIAKQGKRFDIQSNEAKMAHHPSRK